MGSQGEEPERLVLLETLVHSVHYDKEAIEIDPDVRATLGPTCVTVRFLDRPALAVTEQDHLSCYSDRDVLIQAGKSILFAAANEELLPPCPAVEMIISRKRFGTRDYIIGKGFVPLTDNFTQIFNTSPASPACDSLQGVYDFRDTCSKVIGCVSLFLRLSAFGKMLIAGEEMNPPEEDCFTAISHQPVKKTCLSSAAIQCGRTIRPIPPSPPKPPCPPPEQQGPCVPPPQGTCSLPSPLLPPRFCPDNIEFFPLGYSLCQRIIVGDPSSSDDDEEGGKKKKGFGCPLEPTPGEYCLRTDCPCGLTFPPWMTPPLPPPPPRPFILDPGAVGVHCGQVIFDLGENEDGERATPEGAQFRVEPAAGAVPCLALTGPPGSDTWPEQEPGREVFLLRASRRTPDGSKPMLELELRAPKCPDKRFIDQHSQWHEPEKPAKGKKSGKSSKGNNAKGKAKGKKK